MTGVEFLPQAREELLAAVEYYESIAPDLGVDFLLDIETAVQRIRAFPSHGSPWTADTRRVVIRRFPFDVVYLEADTTVIVVAIAHQRRSPFYWKKRL